MLSMSCSEAWPVPPDSEPSKTGGIAETDAGGGCLPPGLLMSLGPRLFLSKRKTFLRSSRKDFPSGLVHQDSIQCPWNWIRCPWLRGKLGNPAFSIRQRWSLWTRVSLKGGYWLQLKLLHIMAWLLMQKNKQEQMVAFRMLDLYIYTSTRSV